MNIKDLLGEAYKDSMTIEEINAALKDKNLVDPDTLPPTVPKSTFDKTASELAELKRKNAKLENDNLSSEEKLKKALEDADAAKDEYTKKSVRLDVERVLVQGGLTENDYKDVIDGVVTTDAEKSVAMAKSLVSLLDAQKKAAENAVTKKLQEQLKDPPGGNSDPDNITADDFKKMTLTDKIKFKEEHPDIYKELAKK